MICTELCHSTCKIHILLLETIIMLSVVLSHLQISYV